MSDVLVIRVERYLKSLIKEGEEKYFVLFTWETGKRLTSIDCKNIITFEEIVCDEVSADEISQSYIDFIGELGSRYKQDEWWIICYPRYKGKPY